MKISVIMAAFNADTTIERAINSFLQQNYKDKELIIIDGSSTDNTQKIVEQYLSSEIKFLSEKDSGLYDALNKGISFADGDIIGTLHSDDFYAHNDVLKTAGTLLCDPEIDITYADVEFFRNVDPKVTIRHYSSAVFCPNKLKYGIMPAHPTIFLKRRFFDDPTPYDLSFRIAADFDFVARIFLEKGLRHKYVPETWIKMQYGGLSTSGIKSNIRIMSEILKSCRKNNIDTNLILLLSRIFIRMKELKYQRIFSK